MSKWAEIRNDFVCEDSHKIYIDAWLTADDNEEGVVIARIDMDTKKIEYFDDAAKIDGYAQEIIKETIEELSKHGESRKDSSSRQKGEEMAKFYFTYGTSEQYPFRGGWSEIHAPDLCAATQIFKAYHPNPYGDCVLNCADYYTEEEFHENDIFISGNLGAFCHEVIRPTAMSGKVIADVAPKRMSEELQAVLNLAQFIETEFQEDTPATGFQYTVDQGGSIGDFRYLFTVKVGPNLFVDVMYVADHDLVYVMQNEDGSVCYDSNDNFVSNMQDIVDEKKVEYLVRSVLHTKYGI